MNPNHDTIPGSVATAPLAGGGGRMRLAGLDGLRAVAVAAVVLFHLFPAVLPGGFIGVDVFFVISGFLITGLLVSERERTGRLSLPRFWQRRLRRLVPPLVPLVLLCCTAAWLVGGDVLVGLGWQLLGASTFGYNWVSIANSASYFTAGQPELFRNLWSLAVEEQFYLIWPFVLLGLLLIRNARVRLGLVCLLALASVVWMGVLYQPGADPTRVYYGSDTHSFGLGVGAALALLLHAAGQRTEFPRARPWFGLAALIGLLCAAWWLPADGAAAYRGGLLAVSLLTAVAIWAGVRGGRFGRALDAAPLRYLGERSYGIYLWHWPVLVLLQAAWPSMPAESSVVPIGVLAAALTLAAAAASYRWLEAPIRRSGVRPLIRRVAALANGSAPRRKMAGATAVLGLLLVAGTTAALLTAPASASTQVEIDRGQRALDAAARSAAKSAHARASGSIPAGTLITAVGDSVMLASAPELQKTFPGITIDAVVSRGMASAPRILSALAQAGTLRPVVVLGLGTNGPIGRGDLAAIENAIGPDRELILVNAFADRGWTPGVNAALSDFAARNRLVELANWHDAIAPHADVLGGDKIHPGAAGGQIYADCVTTALQRLAELPPLRVPGAHRLLPFPV